MDFIHIVEPHITEAEINAVSDYLRSGGWLTEFGKTKEFERKIAEFLGAQHCVVLTSGTVGLYLALLAAGIKPGDKVFVPNYTMIATVNAVKWAGAEPVLVDIDPHTMCLDLKALPGDERCKAMIYVEINGRCGEMPEVVEFCRKNNLVLIEDACQAMGATNHDRLLGTWGDMGVFSFTPHKLITTGQGGAVVTNQEDYIKKVKGFKDFDREAPGSDWHEGIGFNFKFTDLQAVIGIEQIKKIDFHIQQRKKNYQQYREGLKDIDQVMMLPMDVERTTPWFNDVLLPSQGVRDALVVFLKERFIGARPFYPPINHQKPYSHFARGTFPVSEDMAVRGLWLPSSIGLTNEQIAYVCAAVKDFFKNYE